MKCLLLIAILFLQSAAIRAKEVLRYEGSARDPQSGTLLYRETHYLSSSQGQPDRRLVLYRCPQGEGVFARKQVLYRTSPQTPDFELIDARLGYREGLRREGERSLSTFVQRSRLSGEDRQSLKTDQAFVADAGFDEFLKQQWRTLHSGKKVRLNFLVPAELGTIAFQIRKHREEWIAGRRASVIRLSLGAWWGFLAPHIDAAYDQETQVLLRYQGLSNVRGSNGRNLNVRVDFPPQQRVASDADSLDAAGRLSMTADCAALAATDQRAGASS